VDSWHAGHRARGRPTLHGGPVRLRPVRATPCYSSVLLRCDVQYFSAVCVVSTYFGRENEISGFTWFDGRGVEFDQNHWMLIVHTPGSDVYDVPVPAEATKECPQICHNTCVTGWDEKPVKVLASGCQQAEQATEH